MRRPAKPQTSACPVGENSAATRSRGRSAWLSALLGPPPITDHEDPAAFAALEDGLAAGIRPRDAVEWLWVRNLAELEWDIRLLRRVKVGVFALSRDAAARVILDAEAKDSAPPLDDLSAEEAGAIWLQVLAETENAPPLPPETDVMTAYEEWFVAPRDEPKELAVPPQFQPDAGSASERERLAMRRLAELGLPGTVLESEAFRRCLAEMERLERLIAGAEARRDAIYRDLERRRASRRDSLAQAQVIDAEFDP